MHGSVLNFLDIFDFWELHVKKKKKNVWLGIKLFTDGYCRGCASVNVFGSVPATTL